MPEGKKAGKEGESRGLRENSRTKCGAGVGRKGWMGSHPEASPDLEKWSQVSNVKHLGFWLVGELVTLSSFYRAGT